MLTEKHQDGSDFVEEEIERSADRDAKQIVTFTVAMKALGKVWSSTFRFELKPVTLERIDVLEARLVGVEEDLRRVCGESRLAVVKDGCREKQRVPTLTEFEVLAGAESGNRRSQLRWKEVTSECFTVEEDGAVRSLVTGTFLVTLQLSCALPSSRQPPPKLLVQAAKEEERCYIVEGAGYANANGVY